MYNRVIVIGNLTKDPDLRYTPQGVAVVTLRLAINRTYKTKSGEKKEEACFISAVAWNKPAENCNQYLSKGSKILVEGRLQSRSWENAQGQKQYALEIFAENVKFLSTKKKEETQTPDTGADWLEVENAESSSESLSD